MRGIYIHIPFCSQACRYCDFYFSVSLQYMDSFVEALVSEIGQRGKSHAGRDLETLYLGGGTPSLLSYSQLERILDAVQSHHSFRENPEWTIECNPDNLDKNTLGKLHELGFNRLSIGIQSFHDRDLDIMRRSHNAEQAEASVNLASKAGFENITIDLIYGIPGQRIKEWEENLDRALSLPVSHLSAYHLTFEPGTVFDHWRKKGRLLPVNEEDSLIQYRILREKMLAAGFTHYELSNFGRGTRVSEHNMLYWSGLPYLGLGPSAHSFDGKKRSWNASSLHVYMDRISKGEDPGESEQLDSKEQYHDYLITSLRTRWGADSSFIESTFGRKFREHFEKQARPFLEQGSMSSESGIYIIKPEHWLITDHILRALFMD